MRFDFQKISSSDIRNRLEVICKNEHFSNYEETIDMISKMCKNQCRDAISFLDKVSAYSSSFDVAVSSRILGSVSIMSMINLTNSIIDDNEKNALSILNDLYVNGVDLKLFVDQYLTFVLDVVKYLLFGNLSITNIPRNYSENINGILNFKDAKQFYNYLIDKVLSLKNMIKNDSNCKNTIEVAILQMCRLI